jgi:phosphoadenosine phosphosulfate reductase
VCDVITHPQLGADELRELNADFETATAADIVAWAAKQFGHGLAVTSSFADPILAHLAWSTVPGIDVVLIDTQYLFAETVWYAKHLADRTGGSLRILTPAADVGRDDLWMRDTDMCCAVRKVAPLEHLLANRSSWVTGLRRDDGPTRANTPIVFHDVLRDVIKVNPIARWTDGDVASYMIENDLPPHPLADRGYSSIGCWPCTVPSDDPNDKRAGRWAGQGKTECGLHGNAPFSN